MTVQCSEKGRDSSGLHQGSGPLGYSEQLPQRRYNTELQKYYVYHFNGYVSLWLLTALSPAISANSSSQGTPAPTQASSCCHNVYNYNGCSTGPSNEVKTLLLEIKTQLAELQRTCQVKCKVFKNCADLYKSGQTTSGVYTIDPDGSVFQKRLNGSVDFYRGWADYKNGFGDLAGEFWLGLDKIHRLTSSERYKLRVDLEDTNGKTAYAEYDHFAVTNESTKYKLGLGSYSGTAGDSLSSHRGYPFSTKDQDNDVFSGGNCAVMYKGAWWYTKCHGSNLNGVYHHGAHSSYADGVNWKTWKGYHYSAKRAEMKIRPENF
ncbi:hypothetical protein ACROYT_G008249 [Oculina patagonica]